MMLIRNLLSALLLLALTSNLLAVETKPGLLLTLSAGEKTDLQRARLVALYVPAGQPASATLTPGPFTATWTGVITSSLRTKYLFSASMRGAMTLTIEGQPVKLDEEVQLKKGASDFKVEFKSAPEGDSWIRLYWASKEFTSEPVPPAALGLPATLPDELTANQQWREGRRLFAERRCTACHDGGDAVPARGQGMPELAQDAPVFADFGARFKETWLAHWISDPHSIRPHSLMPRVFPGEPEQVDPRAADIAAYLASLGEPSATRVLPEEQVAEGGALFANLGCIACHTAPEFHGEDEHQRTPLGHLQAKWQAPALIDYLQDPQKLYRWTRMPNFRLTAEEAGKLTAFLLAGQQREFAEAPKGDPAKGAQLAATAGCLNCHAGVPPTTAPKLTATLSSGWKKGCVADDSAERGTAPDFGFTPDERDALRAFSAHGFGSLGQDSPADFAARQMQVLRCTACHARDGQPSTWSLLEEEMAPLQGGATVPDGEGQPIVGATAPMLTWAGEKLRTEWAANFIAGAPQEKPRPWLYARMPGFGERSDLLAQGLALQHGQPLADEREEAPPPEITPLGEQLLGDTGGFNCISCHQVGDRAPTAVFEAPGINLALASARLRKGYYHRWVYNPLRIDPETKMPKFADENGKTPLMDVLEGNAHAQYEAIWQFLRTFHHDERP